MYSGNMTSGVAPRAKMGVGIKFYDSCSCTGAKSSCTLECPGPSWSLVDKDGYCHCGCAGGPRIPTYHFNDVDDKATLVLNSCTYQELDTLLALRAEHKADYSNINMSDTVTYNGGFSFKLGTMTIKQIMTELNIPRLP